MRLTSDSKELKLHSFVNSECEYASVQSETEERADPCTSQLSVRSRNLEAIRRNE